MHSMDFYVSTCRCVMQADPNDPESLSELYGLLPCLRQSLTCYVCTKLLLDPMGPTHNVCKHSVCKQCLGGKMKLKPSCSWCKDHSTFQENTLQKILVSCFKKLCDYIYHSPIGKYVCEIAVNGETNAVVSILKEGIEFDDNYEPHVACISTIPLTKCDDPSKCPVAGSSTDDNKSNEMEEDTREQIVPISTDTPSKAIIQVGSPERDTLVSHKRHGRMKSTRKAVVFIKRAAENRRKSKKLKDLFSRKSKKKTISKGRKVISKSDSQKPKTVSFNTNKNNSDYLGEPALERVEVDDELVPKRINQELQPPELKPPSFCRCGKAGTYNQLTCLGQRCPCYSMKLPCIGCRCKGCRNPKKGPSAELSSNSVVLRSSSVYRSQSDALCVNM